ncbi:MAG: YfhO family protein [Candidatus Levyibacteriota bacterium]
MRKEFFWAFLFFIIVSLFFFYPLFGGFIPFPGDNLVGNFGPYDSLSYGKYGPGAVPNLAQGPDVIRELFPWKNFVIESFKQFQIPFWNPYNFSGNPLMANFQSGAFYPLNLVFLIFNFLNGWSIFILLIPVLAGIFTYLFLRELSLLKLASVFGGIVFAFSSYMVVWMEYGNVGHTFLWLPLGLFFTEKLIKKTNYKYIFFLVMVLFFALLAGYIQGYIYSIAIVIFYYLLKNILARKFSFKKTILFLTSVLIFPLGLALFQILPTLELFSNSSRGSYSFEQTIKILNPFWYFITTVAPDFFGNPATRNHWFLGTYIEKVSYFGLIPLILAISAVFNFKKRKEIAIFGALLILSFILATDLFFNRIVYLFPIPIISTMVQTRILSIFVFSGSILSAFGFNFFLKKDNKKGLCLSFTLISVLIFIAWVFVFLMPKIFPQENWTQNLAVAKRNLILPSIFLLCFLILSVSYLKIFKKSYLIKIIIILIFLLTLFDLFRFFQKITPFSPKDYVYPSTPVIDYLKKNGSLYRFWGYGSGYVDSNFQTYDHTFSPEGNDPIHIKNYTEFLSSSKDGTLPSILPRPDANIASGFSQTDLNDNNFRQKVLNILGVKYILNKSNLLSNNFQPDNITFPQTKYKLIWQNAPWQIYENLKVVPRVFLTTNYIVVQDKKEILKKFYSKDFDESKKIILNEDPRLLINNNSLSKAAIISYEPNKVVVQTSSNSNALLFLSDTYYISWKAKVDENATKVYLADYTFRAVAVPKGEHKVTFYFESDSFKKGLVLSGIIFILFITFIIFIKRQKNYE